MQAGFSLSRLTTRAALLHFTQDPGPDATSEQLGGARDDNVAHFPADLAARNPNGGLLHCAAAVLVHVTYTSRG